MDSTGQTGISLRPCDSRDGEFLFALFAAVKAEEFTALNWSPAQLEPLLRMQFTAQSQSYAAGYPGAVHEIVCLEGEPVGRIITDQSAEALLLVDIALIPACRGRGMGTTLIGRLQEQCAARRKPLRLHVAHSNRAGHLYERLEFVTVGGTETHRLMEWHPRP